MSILRDAARAAPLRTYFALAYGWSWLWWIPSVLWYRAHGFGGPIGGILVPVIVGAYGPTFAALATTGLASGSGAVRALLWRYFDFRAGAVWYLAALLAPCLAAGVAIWWVKTQGADVGSFDAGAVALVPMTFLMALPFGPLAEELGWRGFALPRLIRQGSLVQASLVIGIAWTFWHAPLYWAPAGTSISAEHPAVADVAFYLAQVTGLAFLFTWVARHTKGNVVLAILMHLSFNANFPLLFFANLSPKGAGFGMTPLVRQVVSAGLVPTWILVGVVLLIEGKVWWSRADSAA